MTVSLLVDFPNEVPVVAKWYFDEWAHVDEDATLESVIQKLSLSLNKASLPLAFVSHLENKLVGAGEIKQRALPEYVGCHYWLDGIYVPPDHRGKGVAKGLIEFALYVAKTMQLPSLYLRCLEHNVALYQKHGFQVVGEGEAQNKYIMAIQFS